MSIPLILFAILLVLGVIFGLAVVLERASRGTKPIGTPSVGRAIAALAVGLAGAIFIVFIMPPSGPLLLIPTLLLIGSGVYGLLDALPRRKDDRTQGLSEQPPGTLPATRPRMSWRMRLLGGAIVLVILALFGIAWLFQIGQPSYSLALHAEYPGTVRVGERFELTLYLKNASGRPLSVQDIDVHPGTGQSESILASAQLEGTDPAMDAADILGNARSFTYDGVIPAGGTQKVTFHLLASKPTVSHTDFLVYHADGTDTLWDVAITISP